MKRTAYLLEQHKACSDRQRAGAQRNFCLAQGCSVERTDAHHGHLQSRSHVFEVHHHHRIFERELTNDWRSSRKIQTICTRNIIESTEKEQLEDNISILSSFTIYSKMTTGTCFINIVKGYGGQTPSNFIWGWGLEYGDCPIGFHVVCKKSNIIIIETVSFLR